MLAAELGGAAPCGAVETRPGGLPLGGPPPRGGGPSSGLASDTVHADGGIVPRLSGCTRLHSVVSHGAAHTFSPIRRETSCSPM